VTAGRRVRGVGGRRWPALVLLCAADVLVTLDGTVVTVGLPAIERDLETAQADLQWVVTAYTLTLGAFLLVGGRAGALFGRRRVLVVGLVVFALGSAVAGLAQTTGLLLSARTVQGLGAALAVPAALALLMTVYRQERERQQALGYLSAAMDVGMVAGLILGGVLTATVGWPWCFFVVVPIGLLAAGLAPKVLEESRDENAPRLDVLGAVLVAAGFGTLAFGIARFEQLGAATAPVLGGAVVLLAAFVAIERRTPAPMVRLSIFRHRALTGANLAIIANAGGFGGMLFIATLYLQQVLEFLPWRPDSPSCRWHCRPATASRIVAWTGPRRAAGRSMAISAAAFVLLSRTPEDNAYHRRLHVRCSLRPADISRHDRRTAQARKASPPDSFRLRPTWAERSCSPRWQPLQPREPKRPRPPEPQHVRRSRQARPSRSSSAPRSSCWVP
jgi:MFS family permease